MQAKFSGENRMQLDAGIATLKRAQYWQHTAEALKLRPQVGNDAIEQLVKSGIRDLARGDELLGLVRALQDKAVDFELHEHIADKTIEQILKDWLRSVPAHT